MIFVGPPGGLAIVSRPSTTATRCASPDRPVPRAGSAPPVPSSATLSSQHVALSGRPDGDPVREAVLGRVGQQFGGAEVRDGLDRGGGPDRDATSSSTGIALSAASEARASASPLSSTGGWIPRARPRSSPQRVLGAPERGVDQLADSRGVRNLAAVAELLPGHAEVHGQRGQPDLRAVVQVPLEPPQQGGGVVHGQRPAQLQVVDPLRQPPGPEQAPDQPGVGGRDGPGHPRGGQQHRRSRRGGGERAGEGRDAERALAEHPERREHRHRAQPDPRRVVAERPPPERVTQVDQPADPEEHGVQLDQADRQLGQQVGDDPPAGPVARARAGPGPAAGAPPHRRRRRDPRPEQPGREPALQRAEPAGRRRRHQQHEQQSQAGTGDDDVGRRTGYPARRRPPARSGPRRERRAPAG